MQRLSSIALGVLLGAIVTFFLIRSSEPELENARQAEPSLQGMRNEPGEKLFDLALSASGDSAEALKQGLDRFTEDLRYELGALYRRNENALGSILNRTPDREILAKMEPEEAYMWMEIVEKLGWVGLLTQSDRLVSACKHRLEGWSHVPSRKSLAAESEARLNRMYALLRGLKSPVVTDPGL